MLVRFSLRVALSLIGGLFSVTSGGGPVVACLAAVLARLFSVGVAGQSIEGGVDAGVSGLFALFLRLTELLEGRRSIRSGCITIAATPSPIDAGLRAVGRSGGTVIGANVGRSVAGIS